MRSLLFPLLVASTTLAAGKGPETAKIFTDKGSTYIRSDNKKALAVGAELDAVVDAKKPDAVAGKAVIMEVTGALARVSLDDDAVKAGAKFVVLPKASGGGGGDAQGFGGLGLRGSGGAKPADDDDEEKAPAPRTPGRKLSGKLTANPLQFAFGNDEDASWTECKLVHSDGSSYEVGEVVKHTDDTVMRVKLSSPPEPAYDHLVVICSEGKSKFYFDKPHAPQGKLKGYATNNGGSVIVYNQNDTAWTSCDVRKPNGTHYVLGNLKGHSDDSIDKGRFKKEEDNKPKWIELRCKEGELHTAL